MTSRKPSCWKKSRPEKDNRLLKDEDRRRYLEALQETNTQGTGRWNVTLWCANWDPREIITYHLKKTKHS